MDTVHRFLFEELDIRGVLVQLGPAWRAERPRLRGDGQPARRVRTAGMAGDVCEEKLSGSGARTAWRNGGSDDVDGQQPENPWPLVVPASGEWRGEHVGG